MSTNDASTPSHAAMLTCDRAPTTATETATTVQTAGTVTRACRTALPKSTVPQRMLASLDGDAAGLGARLVDTYLRLWEESATRPILLSLVRSAVTSDRAAQMLFEVMGARLRDADGIAGATDQRMRRELVAEISPAIQHYLSGPAES
ncbi:TetR/AcrR family transcriptional regulator [Microbacterium terrisoli]|uniref:TetR/AcrR family transcriptional regulator n=1 Tax=Microbacterium terrisoli TaxID=3242192 RepID=UPI0028061F9A|nr:hypothetical protein [Microbacterium protaetiae]